MLHPYKHLLLHKQHSRNLLKQVEHDLLVQLVSQSTSQLQPVARFSQLFSKWWTYRWNVLKENRSIRGKIIMPEV